MEAAIAIDPQAFGAAPQTATTVECRVVRVLDGDTVEVEVRQLYRVRLLDCWAAETKGDSKEAGLAAKEHLRNYIGQTGMNGVLSVPWHEDSQRSWSMGRMLGNIWLNGQDKSLSEVQVEAGHATKEKQCAH